jgi:hypothetical protein
MMARGEGHQEPVPARTVESPFARTAGSHTPTPIRNAMQRSTKMKRLIALTGLTFALLGGAVSALAQSSPPPLPAMTAQQSATVKQRLDLYRQETEGRVSRGEITADEADRLLKWREWQVARQVTGAARAAAAPVAGDVPPDYYETAPPDYDAAQPRDYVETRPPDYVVEPAPWYGPRYRYVPPPYWGPRPYYWGPAVCAGGFGRHFGGRVCF